MNKENNTNFSFDLPKNRSNVIKVIGLVEEEVMQLTTCFNKEF